MLTLIANNHYAPAACLLQTVHGWLYVSQLFLLLSLTPSNALFATSLALSLSLSLPSLFHLNPSLLTTDQIFYLPIPFLTITPSHPVFLFTPHSPLSLSLFPLCERPPHPTPPTPQTSRGVMPSLAREPKPRCLCWLLLESRSCGEREEERAMERGKRRCDKRGGK